MINILPPELKTQIRYSRYNVVARRYLLIILAIAAVVVAALYMSHRYADEQIQQLTAQLEERKAETDEHQALVTKVQSFNEKLTTIDALLEQRTDFSQVLQDLAAVLPPGSYINGITLTGENTEPLQLLITTPSRNQAVAVRNALLTSPRIASADIQSIAEDPESGTSSVQIVIKLQQETAS